MKKVVFILIFFSLLISFNVEASTLKKSVRLDKETLNKGYTLSNSDFSVGIQPNTFFDQAIVYLRPLNLDKSDIELPDNLNLISDVYVYNIKVSDQQLLPKVIWLSLNYESDSNYQKDLYFFNGVTNKWQKLLSSDDKDNKKIKSGWWFPYSIVAVFEDLNEISGPVKNTNYSDFSDFLDASAAIVIDEDTGKILYKKNIDEKRSIASLTKIMTALVFLETETSLDKVITYNSKNNREGASLSVSDGETMKVQDIFYCMLVGSGNNCAVTLAESTGYSEEKFVKKMNQKASELGLDNTVFADPSGLDVGNQSTASDYAKLMQTALDNEEILKASTTNNYYFCTLNTNDCHSINNTSKNISWGGLYITGAKTGYLDEALYCQTLKAKQDNHEIITVLLGNASSYDRFVEAYDLSKWALANYSW